MSYSNALDFGDAGSLGLGVAWQGRNQLVFERND